MKYSDIQLTFIVCPFEIPTVDSQNKTFEIYYNPSSSLSFFEEAKNFFLDDEFCPIIGFTLMKNGCTEPVDSESSQVLEPETNNLMTKTNVVEGYE